MGQITKAILADVFGVSRSAVTQSTRKKSIIDDAKARIIRELFPQSTNGKLWDSRMTMYARRLKDRVAQVALRRKKDDDDNHPSRKGRTPVEADVQAFLDLIDEIVAEATKRIPVIAEMAESAWIRGYEIARSLYFAFQIQHLGWWVIPKKV